MECRSLAASLSIIFAVVTCLFLPAHAQTSKDATAPDDSLRIYAVNVVKTRFFVQRWSAFGIYLGSGAVITAAHVVGRWPSLTHPRVLIAGQELAANVIKEGSLRTTDLALLSIDKTRLPVSLQLRLNPLCKGPLRIGEPAIVVVPQETERTRIISPLLIAPQFRVRFGTIIRDTRSAISGSGVFDAQRKCLLGIISRRIPIIGPPKADHNGGKVEFAKYFVPAWTIAKFIPSEFRF
jgi:Trypsin-like peptidase domain